MRIAIETFRGEAPRLTPRALPDNAAQAAVNARLVSGDLEAWRQYLQIKSLATDAPVQTIYLLNGEWLSFQEDVNLARGLVAGDTSFRTYITGLDAPRFTTFDLATTGAEPYPVTTRLLGVPAPVSPPTVVLSAPEVVENGVTLVNPGAEVGNTSGWTEVVAGLAALDNADVPGLLPFDGSFFFGGDTGDGEHYQAITLTDQGLLFGQQLTMTWQQATGAAGSKARLGLRFYDAGVLLISEVMADMLAPSPALTWTERTVNALIPVDAVTMRVVMEFENVGGGSTDAYIDDIQIIAAETEYSSEGDDLASWTTSPNATGSASRSISEIDIGGSNGSVFRMSSNQNTYGPWMSRDFDFSSASGFRIDYECWSNYSGAEHTITIGASIGTGDGITITNTGLRLNSSLSREDRGTATTDLVAFASVTNKWLRVRIDGARSGTTSYQLTVTVTEIATGTVLVDGEVIDIDSSGDELLFKHWSISDDGDRHTETDNIFVSLTQGTAVEAETEATAYLFTFFNDLGEESAPSLPTATVLRADGVTVTVTTPTAIPSGVSEDYGIATKGIYRLATGSTGSVYRFVAEIPLAQADYIDSVLDAELGEVLQSEDWDLPPDDLRGIIALPNGIMAGFRRNQLCLSEQNYPHAWPVAYRLPTDTDIVAIANVDTTIVIGTGSFVYTASGNTPDGYSMSTPGVAQACTSKRSMAVGFGGALFAAPDGLMLATGPTLVQNLTANLFTRNQWQALNPSSMLGVVHDDIYFLFYEPVYGSGRLAGGYAIDAKPDGFGIIQLSAHATAAHVDPLTDALHLVLDLVDEPMSPYLLAASTAPDPDGATIYQFDGDDGELMVYRWRGKLNLLPWPICFQMFKAQAADFDNLVLRLYADGELFFEEPITSASADTLPMLDDYREFEIELIGTSTVRRMQVVEDVAEIT
jgi:hypothetical protein